MHLKQASLSPIGDRKPSTKRDFRASFIKRCKNQTVNDKLHLIRTLNSTLKVDDLLQTFCVYMFFRHNMFGSCSIIGVELTKPN